MRRLSVQRVRSKGWLLWRLGWLRGRARLFSWIAAAGVLLAVAACTFTVTILDGFLEVYQRGLLAFQSPITIMHADETIELADLSNSLAGLWEEAQQELSVSRALTTHGRWRTLWLLLESLWNKLLATSGEWYYTLHPTQFVRAHAPPAWLSTYVYAYRDDIHEIQNTGINRLTPFIYREGMLVGANIAGVIIRGMDPQDYGVPITWRTKGAESDAPGLVLGSALAERLGHPDTVQLYLPESSEDGDIQARHHTLVVQGIFETGLYEFDHQFAYMDITILQALANAPDAISGVEVGIDHVAKAEALAEQVRVQLGPDYHVSDWRERNQQTMAALRLEKLLFGLIMGLLVAVAACNMLASTFMNILQRQRSIAMLRALGLPQQSVAQVLMTQSMTLSCVTIVLGIATGVGAAFMLHMGEWFALDPSVYFVSRVPAQVSLLSICSVGLGALALCYLAACRATRTLETASISESLGKQYSA